MKKQEILLALTLLNLPKALLGAKRQGVVIHGTTLDPKGVRISGVGKKDHRIQKYQN